MASGCDLVNGRALVAWWTFAIVLKRLDEPLRPRLRMTNRSQTVLVATSLAAEHPGLAAEHPGRKARLRVPLSETPMFVFYIYPS